jgi:hypothetical protein
MDMTSEWEDVTDVLKPVVDLIFEYETIFNIAFEQLRNGLMLNRDRFAERADLRKEVKNKLKKKKISKEMAQKHLSSLDELDSQMNNKFWDFSS